MLEKDLIILLNDILERKTETSNIEFKAAKEGTPENIYDTLSSFSNTQGGIIIFGVNESENYSVTGVSNPDKLLKKITEQCEQMSPEVRPIFTVVTFNDKIVVSLEVGELSFFEKPCYYKGKGKAKGSFIRVGDADKLMSDFEIYNFEVHRRKINNELRTFDRISEKYINENLLNAYIGKLLLNKPNLKNLDRSDLLAISGLQVDYLPTLCNILIFGKAPQMISPMLDIVCTVPSSENYGVKDAEEVRFLDNRRIDGTLVDLINGALSFVNTNMRKQTIVNKNGKREDKFEYPLIAIREAILNAVIHRDYSVYTENRPITITMFNDRIEIENPGNLYGSMKVEDLGKKRAEIRNPFIASTLEILMETENRHSGIPTMYAEMEKAALLPPKFENLRDSFKVTFYNTPINDMYNNIKIDDILDFCKKPRSKASLAEKFGFDKDRPTFFFNTYILPLIEKGLLAYTLPEKPKSKNQKIYTK